jgi:hypothetical protein
MQAFFACARTNADRAGTLHRSDSRAVKQPLVALPHENP